MSWQQTLLDASFKGVPFEVTDDSLKGRHALAEHEYPYVDGADIEDTGGTALEISLTAVLYGDNYEGRLQNLIKVLRETGAGELIHPIYGSVPDCVVTDFDVRHNEDSPDFAEITIGFKQSVAAAPFFERELPLALADELDFLADLATWRGFAVFEQALSSIQKVQSRWNAFHALSLGVMGVLYGQVNGIFSGTLNLINSPRVLVTELRAIFGSLTQIHRRDGGGLAGWRDLVRDTSAAAATPWAVHTGTASYAADALPKAQAQDTAVLTALVATTGACALAEEAADVLASELRQPMLTPVEISRLLADVRDMLQRAMVANRIVALMLSAPGLATQLAYYLVRLYQSPASTTEGVYQAISEAGLLPDRPYLEGASSVVEDLRTMAHILQRQATAVVNLRPPLVRKTVHVDASLHLLAFWWYGDFSRQHELLRLNPQIVNPNFVSRGSVLNAYAR